jgi:hypothetical protein
MARSNPVTFPSLAALTGEFLAREDIVPLELHTPSGALGRCDIVANLLYRHLRQRGIPAALWLAKGLRAPAAADAAPVWRRLSASDPGAIFHVACLAGDWVVDATSAQFGHGMDNPVIRSTQFSGHWNRVRRTRPWQPVRLGHRDDRALFSAVRFPSGVICAGAVHADAWDLALEAGFSRNVNPAWEGYLTCAGHFMDRQSVLPHAGHQAVCRKGEPQVRPFWFRSAAPAE